MFHFQYDGVTQSVWKRVKCFVEKFWLHERHVLYNGGVNVTFGCTIGKHGDQFTYTNTSVHKLNDSLVNVSVPKNHDSDIVWCGSYAKLDHLVYGLYRLT